MAFDVEKQAGGYGTGELGVVINPPAGNINTYASVTAISANTITIANVTSSQYLEVSFAPNKTIMIHVSLGDAKNLGLYMVCKIISNVNNVLTLDKDPLTVFPNNIFTTNKLQAIVAADFDRLILNNNHIISPLAFNLANGLGGILFIRCKTSVLFNGGHIKLQNCGIPTSASVTQRPATAQETVANISDEGKYSAWENHITANRFLLNRESGALFLVSQLIVGDENSRIGNTNATGANFTRTNICGGSTILMACNTFSNFSEKMIAKSNQNNRGNLPTYGFSRCYIASNTKLRNDEGLYAYDTISDKNRLTKSLNIKSFGEGNVGSLIDPARQFNNYAYIISIDSDGKTITCADKTTNGIAPFRVGELVMVHVSCMKGTNTSSLGKFKLARIEAIHNTTIKLDIDVSDVVLLNNYHCQVISIPEFENLVIAIDYNLTPKWNGKIGGICAIAVSNTFDLSSGKINMTAKGGATAYGRAGLAYIGNAQDADTLPIGEGHGSVFILANKLVMNEKTRIGATYSGANLGGTGWNQNYSVANNKTNSTGGGYKGKSFPGIGGWPGTTHAYAGYGSNGQAWNYYNGTSYHGAHIMIIADTISNFNIAAISTGGSANYVTASDEYCGGAGYGGGSADAGAGANGGGYLAGGADADYDGRNGGGGSGWAFIYCNNTINENNSEIVIPET